MSEQDSHTSFRLASDRDYRRGVILGLTLAEVLLLLVFLLLLAAGALLARTQEEAARQAARLAELQSQLQPVIDALNRSGHAVSDIDNLAALLRRGQEATALDNELNEMRSALAAADRDRRALDQAQSELKATLAHRDQEIEGLRSELNEKTSALAKAESDRRVLDQAQSELKATLTHRDQEIEGLRGELDEKSRALATAESDRQALAQARSDLEAARQEVAKSASLSAKAAGYDNIIDALRALPGGIGDHPQQDLMNRLGQYGQAMQELARLKGNGSGLPYCWVTPTGQPIYMLRVELHDDGFLVLEQQPRPRPDDPAWKLLANLPRGTGIRENDLVTLTAPLVSDANQRRCRYAVDVLDRTRDTNKQGYKHFNYVLDHAFARHEIGG